ncbi:MAG TPA: hypothetical protein VMI54_11245 [Polyangiaceae bacterium]|nr:hypothetical protein [Polyangiaceae bacterium]
MSAERTMNHRNGSLLLFLLGVAATTQACSGGSSGSSVAGVAGSPSSGGGGQGANQSDETAAVGGSITGGQAERGGADAGSNDADTAGMPAAGANAIQSATGGSAQGGAGGKTGSSETVLGELTGIPGATSPDEQPILLDRTHLMGQGAAQQMFVDSHDDLFVAEGILPNQLTSVVKYDSSLAQQWSDSSLAPSTAAVRTVAVSARGETFVGGNVTGALPGEASLGGTDAFVGKLDADDKHVWMHQWGSDRDDSTEYLVGAADGSVFATGTAGGSIPNDAQAAAGAPFAARYENDGALTWLKQPTPRNFGVAGNNNSNLVVDGTGTLYQGYRNILRTIGPSGELVSDTMVADSTGSPLFLGLLSLDGSGNSLYTTTGDLFDLALNGSVLWWRKYESQMADIDTQGGTWSGGFAGVHALAVGGEGLYLTGPYDNVYPNLKPSQAPVVATYVGRYDSQGNQLWFKEFLFEGTTGDLSSMTPVTTGGGIAVKSNGNALVVLNGILSGSTVWYAFELAKSDGSLL